MPSIFRGGQSCAGFLFRCCEIQFASIAAIGPLLPSLAEVAELLCLSRTWPRGAQFTSAAFTGRPKAAGIAISIDGRGRFMDNISIERLWRSIKYEEVHLKAYADGREARAGIGFWMTFYNSRRPHQAMNNQMPMAVWRAGMESIEAAARPADMDNANALPKYRQ
jgi:putative transposase